MKIAGSVMLMMGLLMTIYTRFTYVTKENVENAGHLEIPTVTEHAVLWQPYVGIGVMIVGSGVIVLGIKNHRPFGRKKQTKGLPNAFTARKYPTSS